MVEGRKFQEALSTEGEKKSRMLKAQQWVLEHCGGDRFGFSPEEAMEPLAALINHQRTLEMLLVRVENGGGTKEEKRQQLIAGLEELAKDIGDALEKLKEIK